MTSDTAKRSLGRSTRWQRLRYWTIRISVSIALPLLAAEGILRLVYREEEANANYWGTGAFVADERLGYRHAPGFTGHAARRGAFFVPVEINAQGLRQSNFEEQRRFPRRLLLLGASYVFGLGVTEEAGFASLIQGELNAEGVGVINAAQSGYGVEQSVAFGMSWAERVEPAAILLTMVPTYDTLVGYKRNYLDREIVFGCRLPRDRFWPVPAVDYLRTNSFLWRIYLGRLVNQRYSGRGMADYEAAQRADPEGIIQPTLAALDQLRSYCAERSIAFGIMMVESEKMTSELDDRYIKACVSAGIPVLRCGPPEFTAMDSFARDSHWNESGHRRAAARVLEFVRSLR